MYVYLYPAIVNNIPENPIPIGVKRPRSACMPNDIVGASSCQYMIINVNNLIMRFFLCEICMAHEL